MPSGISGRLLGRPGPYSPGQYPGLVATRMFLPNFFTSAVTQAMGRVYVRFTESVTSFKIGFPNFYAGSGSGEVGSGASASITCGFEYAGSTTRVTFGASNTGTIANGDDILSDSINVPVLANTSGWVRYKWVGAGVLYTFVDTNAYINTSFGDCLVYGSSVTDVTQSTGPFTNTDSPALVIYGPHLIVGNTSRPSVFLLGDSRFQGYNDVASADQPVMGDIDRSLWNAKIATANWGIPGDQALAFKTGSTKRVSRAKQFGTHIITNYGGNDMQNASRTSSQVLADLATIQTAIGAEKRWVPTTIYPVTSSSDGWATAGNQTVVNPTAETQRLAYNVAVRGGATGLANVLGYYDIANYLEDVPTNPGKWRTTGVANARTRDGIHANQSGSLALRDSGVVSPALITGDRSWALPV